MLGILGATLESICLKINTSKSVCIVFGAGKYKTTQHKLYLCRKELNYVQQIKYLGVIITKDLQINADIDRVSGDFLKQFNGFYYKFHFLPVNILAYLFKTYTSGFYGCNCWFEHRVTDNKLRKIAVTYHKAVKRVAGKRPWDSNHEACSLIKADIFKHMLAKRIFNQFSSLINSNNVTIRGLRYYFMFKSNINRYLTTLFANDYGLNNYKNNDSSAVRSRIDFTQQHEPRTFYNYAVT